MKTFRTQDLAVKFYHLTQRVKVPPHLKTQLDRASASISLNLAEGNAKFSYRDKSRFYQIAYGSLRECQAIFQLVGTTDKDLHGTSKHLGSSLYRLIQATLKKVAEAEVGADSRIPNTSISESLSSKNS